MDVDQAGGRTGTIPFDSDFIRDVKLVVWARNIAARRWIMGATATSSSAMGLIRFGGHLSKGNTMSKPMADTPQRRPRRRFTDGFKAGAVRLHLEEGKTVGATARDLDLTETALREWVRRAAADRTSRTSLTTIEREELTRLRKELRAPSIPSRRPALAGRN